jgi:3-oxoacyl-[acyl-carrier protein] reductase
MDLGLKGKVAVVAAASKGLGRAVAEELAAEGVKLAICSRDEGRIRATAEEIRKAYGSEIFDAACDVTNKDDVDRFARGVLETYGTAHILFTNAMGPPAGMMKDFGPGDFRDAIETSLMTALNLVYAFLPAMKEQRWGRIIASTSITVKQPLPTLVLSNVSRVGVVAMVKSLSEEVAQYGITANAVAPGYIRTDRVESLFRERAQRENISFDKVRADMEKNIPLGRIGEPREFGALVAFLASERAGYINGETILIDGGMYKGLM